MLGYLIAIPVGLILACWLLYARRPRSVQPATMSPGNIVEPGTLRSVALLTGPNFDEDEGDDPQSMGEPLASAIHDGLRAHGHGPEEPYAGSHGYDFEVPLDGISYSVVCGLYGGAEAEDANEWLVLVTRSTSSRGELQPPENSVNTRKLMSSLHEVFVGMPGLKRVRWYDFNAPVRGEVGHERPF